MNKTFEEYLESFDVTIKKLAKSYAIYPLEWEDIAQELRMHLFEKYSDEVKEFDKWAYITCRNKIRDMAKYHQRIKRGKGIRPTSIEELHERGIEV